VSTTSRNLTRLSSPFLGRARVRARPANRIIEDESTNQADAPRTETSVPRSRDLGRSHNRGSNKYTPSIRFRTQDISTNSVLAPKYRERGRTTTVSTTTSTNIANGSFRRRYRRPKVNNTETNDNPINDSPIVRITQDNPKRNPSFRQRFENNNEDDNDKITNIRVFRRPSVDRKYDRTKYTRKRNDAEVQKIDVDELDEKLVIPTNGIPEINDEIDRGDLLNIIDQEVTTVNSVVESSIRPIAQTDVTTVVPSDRMEQTSDRPEDAIATTTARIETREFNPDSVTIVPTERIIDIANETSIAPVLRRRKVLLRRRPVSPVNTAANADQVKEEERPQTKPRKRKVIRRKRPLQDVTSWSSTVIEDSLEEKETVEEGSKLAPKSTTFEVGNRNDIEESTVKQTGITSVNKDDSESIATTNDHEVTDKVEDFTLAFTEIALSDFGFGANVTLETPILGSATFSDEEASSDSFGAVTTATINANANDEEYRSTNEIDLEATPTSPASTLATAAIDYTESYTFPEETSMPSTDLEETSTMSTLDPDSGTSPMQTIATSFIATEHSTEQYVPVESAGYTGHKSLTRESPVAANTTSRYSIVSLPTAIEENSSEILSRRRSNFLVRRYPATTVGPIADDPGYRKEEEEEDAREETGNADRDYGQDVTEDTTVRNKANGLRNGLSDDTAEFWKHYTTVSSTARIKYPYYAVNRAEDTEDRGAGITSRADITREDVSGSTSISTDRSEIRPRYRIPVIAKRPFDPEKALSPRRYSGISSLNSALEESEDTTETRSARIGQSAFRQPRMRYKLRTRDDIKINKDAAASNRAEPAANTWQYSRTRSYSRRPSLTSTEAAITETLIPARRFDYVADAFHRKQQSLRTTTTMTTSGINDLSDSQNLIDSDYTSTTTAKPLVTRLVTSIVESGTTERQKILIKTKYSSLTSTIRIPADQFSSTTPPSFPVAENKDDNDNDDDDDDDDDDDEDEDDESINEIRQGVERSTLPIEGAFSQRHGNRLTTESQESSTIEIESVFNNLIAGKSSAKQ